MRCPAKGCCEYLQRCNKRGGVEQLVVLLSCASRGGYRLIVGMFRLFLCAIVGDFSVPVDDFVRGGCGGCLKNLKRRSFAVGVGSS